MLDKANNENRELESQLINLANENVQLKNLLSMNENANQSSNRSDGNSRNNKSNNNNNNINKNINHQKSSNKKSCPTSRTPKPNLGEHHLPVINHNDDIDVINDNLMYRESMSIEQLRP
ncbi:10275_t:CDS:2 [Entrophospora sp. SA101]|nr:10275_t:CDS:2 [Entrophospora sp. SA101]